MTSTSHCSPTRGRWVADPPGAGECSVPGRVPASLPAVQRPVVGERAAHADDPVGGSIETFDTPSRG